MRSNHRVVVIGGGFGGLNAARQLVRVAVDLTLIDRQNVHLFQPLLYQVATGGLSSGDIGAPLRWVLRHRARARVWMAEVVALDASERTVILDEGEAVPYDTLVVAAGATPHYFGHDDWRPYAPALKSAEDALEIRRRILTAFECAERTRDPREREALLTFAVVGGGPTGVELAGALSELARDTLRHDFHDIDPTDARVLLLEGENRLLPPFPEPLATKCRRSLQRLGVTIRTGTFVTEITDRWIEAKSSGSTERLECRTVLWAAGVKASSIGAMIRDATGAQLDAGGRVIVEPDLTVPDHPEIFVIGDLAHFAHPDDSPLPGLAPVAIQQGRYAAIAIARRLRQRSIAPFRYRDKGQLATIGRAAAVADLGRHLRFSGYPAWLLWLFVHLMYLVGFQNRVLVFIQWAWHYFTRNRGARVILRRTAAGTNDGGDA